MREISAAPLIRKNCRMFLGRQNIRNGRRKQVSVVGALDFGDKSGDGMVFVHGRKIADIFKPRNSFLRVFSRYFIFRVILF